jgi:hypothetical protein
VDLDRNRDMPGGLPARINERDFQEVVVAWARYCGWAVAHWDVGRNLTDAADGSATYSTPSRFDASGFPDLLLIHRFKPTLVWYRELKTNRARSRLAPEQVAWGELLTLRGHNYDVWYPAIWPEIRQALAGGRIVSAL